MLYHSHTESISGPSGGGFGAGGLMAFGCGCLPSKLLTPLYKETFLLEFETATDKAIVKMNLGITDSTDLSLIKALIIAEILKELNHNGSGNGSGNNSGNNSGGSADKPDNPDLGDDEVDAGDTEYDGISEW